MKYLTLKNFIIFFTVLLFLLPLAVWQDFPYPFINIKAIFLQIGATIIFGLYLLLLLFHWRRDRPRFSWLGIAVLFFYAAMFASAIFGADFWRSFWDRGERMLGIFAMIHYGALFLVWRSVLTKEEWQKLWRVFVVIGMITMLAALYQIFNAKFLMNLGSDRMSSTLGNPIFVAGFALFTLFSSLIFAFYPLFTKEGNKKWSFWRWFWLSCAVISFVVVFATQTRGDIIGLWAGLVFLSVGLVAAGHEKLLKKISLTALAILVLAPLVFFALTKISATKNWPIISRFANVSSDFNTGTRLIFWKTAVIGWEKKKLFGWGWENFYDLANSNYQPQLARYTGQEWVDNAHNILFNTLGTMGLVGLLAYLSIYLCVFYCLFKKFKDKNSAEKFFSITLGAFFTAHLAQNLFAFENFSSYLFFFWLLAGIDVIARPQQAAAAIPAKQAKSSGLLRRTLRVLLAMTRVLAVPIIILAVISVVNKFTIIPAKAANLSGQATKMAMTDFGKAIKLHQQAMSISPDPYSPDIAFEFGQFFLVWLSQHSDFPFTDYRSLAYDMYTLGEGAMNYYLQQNPADVRAGFVLGNALQDGYKFWQNPAYLESAVKEYQKILPYAPNRQAVLWGLARAKMLQGKNDEAIKIAQKAIDADPTIGQSHWMLALIHLNKNDLKNAHLEAKKAMDLGYIFAPSDLTGIFKAFVDQKDIVAIEPLIIKNLSLPKDQLNKNLANIYLQYLKSVNRGQEAMQLEYILNN